jgi:hypothetical protein
VFRHEKGPTGVGSFMARMTSNEDEANEFTVTNQSF